MKSKWSVAIAAILVLCVVMASAVAFEGPRSALVRAGFSAFLSIKGFHLAQGTLHVGGGRLSARDLVINESDGSHFASARNIRIEYEHHGTSLSVRDILVDRPIVTLRREEDGSFNFSRLTGSNAAPGPGPSASPQTPGTPAAALHLHLAVRDGKIELENPYAPAHPGRYFAIDRINAAARIQQGEMSRGFVNAMINAAGTSRPLTARFYENDVARVGELRAHASGVALAPILDLLISAAAFTIEKGFGDISVHAYALGWPKSAGPQWHIGASGVLHDGRLRVIPLITPVRDLSAPFEFYDGVLTFSQLQGSAAGVPLSARGAIVVAPAVSLHLTVDGNGDLHRVRNLLAILKPLPLHGHIDLTARITGAPNDPRVAVNFSLRRGLRYASMPISSASGSLTYSEKHVILPGVSASYAGFRASGNGDVDLSSAGPPSGRFVVALRGPSTRIPWIANLDDKGTLAAHAVLQGPFARLHGDGFIQLTGRKTKVSTAFSGGVEDFTFGPLIASDRNGGSLWFASTIDRLHNYTTDAHLIAHNFAIDLNGRHVALPGIFNTAFGMPPASGSVNAVVSLDGPLMAPAFSTDVHLRRVKFAGARYGDIDATGTGSSGRAHIMNVAVQGPALKLRARGDVARSPNDGALSGSLRGWTVARLDSFARLAPIAGLAHASFSAGFGNHQILAGVRLRDSSARVAGVPLKTATVLVRVADGHIRVYSGSAAMAGGTVMASGELLSAGRAPHSLALAARNIQLASFAGTGWPLTSGEMTAFGTIAGTQTHPRASIGGALSGATIAGRSLNADAQLDYNGHALTSSGSRIFLGNATAIDVSGSVNGLAASSPAADASLHMQAAIHDADLHDLNPTEMAGMPLITGSVNGNLNIGGTLAAPNIAGVIASDVGSLHGVTYENLRATIAASRNAITIGGGSLRVGTSQLAIAGTVSPHDTQVRLVSPRLDLADFNDFFNGADVLGGVGSANLMLATSPSASSADGYLRLHNAMIANVPVGALQTNFSTQRGMIHADIAQHSLLASTTIHSSVSFPRHSGMLPDFKHAVLDTTASAKNIDLSLLAPLLPSRAEGLRGKLSVDASARGAVPRLSGAATFALANGYIRKDPISEFSGRLNGDARGITVPNFRASMNGATVIAHGTYSRNQRINAHAAIAVRDVATLAGVARIDSPIKGAVTAAVDAAGTVQQPLLHALLSAAPGSLYGVAYNGVDLDARYAPGEIAVRNATAQLAQRRGTLAVSGIVPIPFGPQPPQRNHLRRPLALDFTANAINLAAFDPLLREQGSLDGRFDASASAKGTLAQPQLAGTASLRGAIVRSKLETVPLTALNANVNFSNDSINMPYLSGKLGRGSIQASGSGRLLPPARGSSVGALAYAMRFAANRANITVPKFFSGVITADMSLQSNHAKPLLSGDVPLQIPTFPSPES